MPVKVTITSQDFRVRVDQAIGPRAQRTMIAEFARDRLAEAQIQNRAALGYIPPHRSSVDGREGAPLDSVKPDGGVIRFDFEIWSAQVKEIVETLLAELRAASPIVSGDYRDGHALFINGVEQHEVPADIGPSEQLLVANKVPYSMRLEVGVTESGRPFVLQVEPRIYERVMERIEARFGNQAKFTLKYIALPDAAARQRRGRGAGAIESPAILIQPLS